MLSKHFPMESQLLLISEMRAKSQQQVPSMTAWKPLTTQAASARLIEGLTAVRMLLVHLFMEQILTIVAKAI